MVARFFRVSRNRTLAFEPSSGIFPRHVSPAARYAPDGEPEIVLMELGVSTAPATESAEAAKKRTNSAVAVGFWRPISLLAVTADPVGPGRWPRRPQAGMRPVSSLSLAIRSKVSALLLMR